MTDNRLHIFGVRHHGPGSARSLLAALEEMNPDAILLEGPPDADGDLSLAGHAQMTPPVALLVHVPDEPQRAVFYPFASFSPEWVTIRFALERKIPLKFMDLPQWHQLATEETAVPDEQTKVPDAPPEAIRVDPIGELARAAGYEDGERWWDALVETRRQGSAEVFKAIAEAMAALRESLDPNDERDNRREAWMRKTIRAALKEGRERIAAVGGCRVHRWDRGSL